ncbi:MAG: hypothetical protein ACOVOT_04275 [Rubrivivax sp.]|jgi:hypothetical protein|nr:hypothetical protein [Rubrivivax sp.]
MDLKLPIALHDEFDDEIIHSDALLDMASGAITDVRYRDHDVRAQGFPAERQDYDFTCGTLARAGRELEFRVEVDVVGRSYSVTPSELLELKGRAAKLFSQPPGGDSKPRPR